MEEVVVVGAGWAGLAAAARLRVRGVDPLIVDRAHAVGGAAQTHVDGSWILEAGPHAFFPGEPALRRFLEDAGGEKDLISAPAGAQRFVSRRGRRVPLPRSPPGILSTRALSASARLRILTEPLVPARSRPEESVAAFVRRRFGRGAGALADAAVTGIFAGDPDRLSVELAFPRLIKAEREHGSVIRGSRQGGGARGTLAAPRHGMGRWMADRAAGSRTRLGVQVRRIEGTGPFELILEDETIEARRVVLAVPPDVAAPLLGVRIEPGPQARVAIVGLGWKDGADVAKRLAGYGVLNPRQEGRFTLGVLYESHLFPSRAPTGGFLARALVGGRRDADRVDLPDETIITKTVADVLDLHDMKVAPDWTCVLRPPAIPQPELGHEKRLARLVERVSSVSRMQVAGWGWGGVGIEDAVRGGQTAAEAAMG